MAARVMVQSILVVVVAVAAVCGACGSGGKASDAGTPGTGGQTGGGGAAGAGVCLTTSSVGGAPTAPALGCAGWRVDSDPFRAATVSVAGGALMFRDPWAPPSAGVFNSADVALSQESLCGDFDITVVWRDFQSGAAIAPRLQAGVMWIPPAGGLVLQATAEIRGSGGVVTIVNDNNLVQDYVDSTPIDGSSGSFRIARAAGFITVTTTIGTKTVALRSASAFPDQPYTLFLEIGHGPITADADSTTGVATVQVDTVTVTGGGGTVKSDDFSCAN